MVRVAPKEGLDQQTVTNKVMVASRTIDKDVKLSRSEFVGPAVGEELVESGILAIVVSLIAILAYVAFRFEWRMATGAVISLAYDVIVVLGVFSVMQIEYDLTVLAAVLTVVGYSLMIRSLCSIESVKMQLIYLAILLCMMCSIFLLQKHYQEPSSPQAQPLSPLYL